MSQFYKIVKKNSPAHQEVLEGNKHQNSSVLSAGSRYVLIPSIRPVDVGFNVSHAKNRTKRRRHSNLRALTVSAGETKVSIQITASDLRTYKRVTSEKAE